MSAEAENERNIETETALYFYDQDLRRQLRLPIADDAKVAVQPPQLPAPQLPPPPAGSELSAPDPS